jgi:16S rRNA C967 or C1407 C5-methylase (RsmB/RsmF family)
VYSLLREEAEDVLNAPLRARTDLHATDGGSFRLLPHVQGTDGYFVARLGKT